MNVGWKFWRRNLPHSVFNNAVWNHVTTILASMWWFIDKQLISSFRQWLDPVRRGGSLLRATCGVDECR